MARAARLRSSPMSSSTSATIGLPWVAGGATALARHGGVDPVNAIGGLGRLATASWGRGASALGRASAFGSRRGGAGVGVSSAASALCSGGMGRMGAGAAGVGASCGSAGAAGGIGTTRGPAWIWAGGVVLTRTGGVPGRIWVPMNSPMPRPPSSSAAAVAASGSAPNRAARLAFVDLPAGFPEAFFDRLAIASIAPVGKRRHL